MKEQGWRKDTKKIEDFKKTENTKEEKHHLSISNKMPRRREEEHKENAQV